MFVYATLRNQYTQRTVYHAPTFTDLLLDVPRSVYHHNDVVINSTEERAIYHIISLPTIRYAYQVYVADVEILDCSVDKGRYEVFYVAISRLRVLCSGG